MAKEAKLYEKLENKNVKCLACKHNCIIPNGKTGICRIRGNENGKLFLYAYGRPIAVNIDPVEKKPFFHFYPGTALFSLGTFGCNFACDFCQNWDISQRPEARTIENAKFIEQHCNELQPEKAVEIALQNNCKGIAYTYNEPTIWAEYAHDISKLARKKGLVNVFVSSGYESENSLDYLKYIDAYNIDIKGFTQEFYAKHCKTKLDYVLDTVKSIFKRKKWLEITTLVIPGENDNDIEGIAKFIKEELNNEVPLHLTQFHPDYKLLNRPITPIETLEKCYKTAKNFGLKYVYLGNVHSDKESTFCPKCKKLLISRDFYNVNVLGIEKGKCKYCKCKIAGKFQKFEKKQL